MSSSGRGPALALLLLGGFRSLVDAAEAELARRGYKDVRPVHDFAMRAIIAGADNASELGRHLSVSKQAAAKTIEAMQKRGWLARGKDPDDARRKRLRVTKLGMAVLREGEAVFDGLREQWARQIGASKLASLEKDLADLIGPSRVPLDTPGWMARGLED